MNTILENDVLVNQTDNASTFMVTVDNRDTIKIYASFIEDNGDRVTFVATVLSIRVSLYFSIVDKNGKILMSLVN